MTKAMLTVFFDTEHQDLGAVEWSAAFKALEAPERSVMLAELSEHIIRARELCCSEMEKGIAVMNKEIAECNALLDKLRKERER